LKRKTRRKRKRKKRKKNLKRNTTMKRKRRKNLRKKRNRKLKNPMMEANGIRCSCWYTICPSKMRNRNPAPESEAYPGMIVPALRQDRSLQNDKKSILQPRQKLPRPRIPGKVNRTPSRENEALSQLKMKPLRPKSH
jgi:hypothetical protein